nr:hypothetical protein HAGR004_01330 [Bdellovibrio sp. HAGR004]
MGLDSASSQKQNAQTKEVWPRVQQAVENRDEAAAHAALSGLGNYITVEDDNGEFTYFETSKVSANVSRIINTLKNCDIGLKNKNRTEINKCTSMNGEKNHLSIWLDEFSRRYPKTVPLNEKNLTAKFDAAEEKYKSEDAVREKERQAQNLKDKAELAKAEFEANQKAIQLEEQNRKHEAYLNSPLGQACSANNMIQIAKKTIADEKAAAKHSGVVDQGRLYGAGHLIEMQSKILAEKVAEYKKTSGKEWNASQCK